MRDSQKLILGLLAITYILPGCAMFESSIVMMQSWRLDDHSEVVASYEQTESAVSRDPSKNYKRTRISIVNSSGSREVSLVYDDGYALFEAAPYLLEVRASEDRQTVWVVNLAMQKLLAVLHRRSTGLQPDGPEVLQQGIALEKIDPSKDNTMENK